jgi:hypothetical protein
VFIIKQGVYNITPKNADVKINVFELFPIFQLCNITKTVLFCALQRAHTFLVLIINPLFADNNPLIINQDFAQKMCKLLEI